MHSLGATHDLSKPITANAQSVLRQLTPVSEQLRVTLMMGRLKTSFDSGRALFMAISAYMSSKLPMASQAGFALQLSQQPKYEYRWHMHDCAMLLWPRLGGLKTTWANAENAEPSEAGSITLTRGIALLLPASVAHRTRSETIRQHHGELYLAPELIDLTQLMGPVHLDGSSQAMLEALMSPVLKPSSAEWLVKALVEQLGSSRRLEVAPASEALSSQMMRTFVRGLDDGCEMPSVEAVACLLGVSTRTLQRVCQDELGVSPVAARRRLLATRAIEMLNCGHRLSAVSTTLGFANSGHLTRLLESLGLRPDVVRVDSLKP